MPEETVNPYESPAVPDGFEVEQPTRAADRSARRALVISFGANGILVGALLFFACVGNPFSAATTAAAFVVIIAGVHFIGYRLWHRQSARANSSLPPGGGLRRE
jgi:hypothetical protein